MKMQKVSLPLLRDGMYVNHVTNREPPSRSWSRYKKLLIDNPKDSNLLQRQKLWNFQKLNRGAFRAQLKNLPDIPYRVHTTTVEKHSVGTQSDFSRRFSVGLKVIFPNLSKAGKLPSIFTTDDSGSETSSHSARTRDKACSPMHLDDVEEEEYLDDFEDDSSVDDPGFEFDSVMRIQNAGTMTDVGHKKEKRVKRKKKKDKNASILVGTGFSRPKSFKKNVKFSHSKNDVETQTPDIPMEEPKTLDEAEEDDDIVPMLPIVDIEEIQTPRVPSVIQSQIVSSVTPRLASENIGHSSQMSQDPLSVLDFLSGSRSDRSLRSENRKSRAHSVRDTDADRVWFEQIVGDVDIIDTGTYDNFARNRPGAESQSDSNTERNPELNKTYSPRKHYTPRLNNEFPNYTALAAKNLKKNEHIANSVNNKNKNSKRGLMNVGKMY